MDDRPIAFLLCGPSGSGKSTLRKAILAELPGAVVASSDDYLEVVGDGLGISYQESYAKFRSDANRVFKDRIGLAVDRWRDLIIDRTSLSVDVRAEYLSPLRESHRLVAIVPEFDLTTPEAEMMLLERNRTRRDRTGAPMPEHSVLEQIGAWEMPTEEEGFEAIIPLIGRAADPREFIARLKEAEAEPAGPGF